MRWMPVTFEVSADGQMRFAGRSYAPRMDSRGYQNVHFALHRLVAAAFHGGPPNDGKQYVVDHIDGNTRNNSPENLRWVTQAVNCRNVGRMRCRKLTTAQRATIKAMRPVQAETIRAMAKRFGVTDGALRALRSGRTHNGKPQSNRRRLTDGQIREALAWRAAAVTAPIVARRYQVSKATVLSIWHEP